MSNSIIAAINRAMHYSASFLLVCAPIAIGFKLQNGDSEGVSIMAAISTMLAIGSLVVAGRGFAGRSSGYEFLFTFIALFFLGLPEGTTLWTVVKIAIVGCLVSIVHIATNEKQ